MILETLRDYFRVTDFHGYRFIAEKERHWTERLFWVICVCASWSACFFVISSSLDAFRNNALSFGADTNYINWNTSLFAVSVCEDNEDVVWEKGPKIFGNIKDNNLLMVLKEISFVREEGYFIGTFCFGGGMDCPKSDLKKLGSMLRSTCEETFELCKWNNDKFNCCEYFQVLETEIGPCFSLNSLQLKNPKSYPLISNKLTGPGKLYLQMRVDSRVYIHSPLDVPTVIAAKTEFYEATLNHANAWAYSITEIVNEEEVRDVDISQRRCRYPEENYLKSYPYYSYTACTVDCRSKKQIDLCNCTNHFAPGIDEEQHCDLEGLRCLNDHFLLHSSYVMPWSKRKGLTCDCLPGCTEPQYDLLDDKRSIDLDYDYDVDDEEQVSVFEMSLDRLPTLRLKRSVVRGRLDLVVSLGGTAGLFVGASLLSFVEVIYFFTIRTFNSYKAKKKENKSKKLKKTVQSNSDLRNEIRNAKNELSNVQNLRYPERYLSTDFHSGYQDNYFFM